MKKIIQKIRLIVQILFIIFLPSLITVVFGFLRLLTKYIFDNSTILIGTFEAVLILIFTIVLGRFFCGWICSFGALNDILSVLRTRVFKIKKVSIDYNSDKILKLIKYLILIVVILLSWSNSFDLNPYSPWDAFASLTNPTALFSSIFWGLMLLVAISIGALYIDRFFCRYLCPLGAIYTILSNLKIMKIRKERSKCLKGCKACSIACPMNINLDSMDVVNDTECINCLKCTNICPVNNARLTIVGSDVNESLVMFATIGSMSSLLAVNNVVNSNYASSNATTNVSTTLKLETNKYASGTYTGTAIGYAPNLTVKVTILNDKIEKIEIVSCNDTPTYSSRAISIVPNEIVKSQSADVEVVSGATRTSNGIINAVKNALESALINNSGTGTSNVTNTVTNSVANNTVVENTTTNVTTVTGKYIDGTYTGSASGYMPNLTVTVTVLNDKITSIQIGSNSETSEYASSAFNAIPGRIVSAQSTNVAVVSGATRTSNGIKNAVNNALSKALVQSTNTNSTSTTQTNTGGSTTTVTTPNYENEKEDEFDYLKNIY